MALVASQSYETVRLSDVTPSGENPRQGDVGAIHESIVANGFFGALIVQRSTRRILAGNHRYRAAHAAGLTELPAIVVDCDDETARRILLVDNRTSDLATYDEGALASLLQSLDDLDELLKSADEPLKLDGGTPKETTCPACGHVWTQGGSRNG